MASIFIAWWNLENLFDIEQSPRRIPKLESKLKNELQGWTQAVLDRKITQLSSIIKQLNGGAGPDILGVCEVENECVMNLLVQSLQQLGRNYAVHHHDCKDDRGIDIALIYDDDLFNVDAWFSHFVYKRSCTRDLYQVNFRTNSGKQLAVVGNHWPSRTSGEMESEPLRIVAAETLAYWVEQIPEKNSNPQMAIVLMGDFNDEPFNRSVKEHIPSSNCETKVKNAQKPLMFNLMWPFLAEGNGTHYYDNFPNVLDQFLVSKSILTGSSGFKLVKANGSYPVKMEKFPETVASGDYPKPIKFGRPSEKDFDQSGYSDHFPISLTLTEVTT